ncbi:MAG: ABC transporter ATP-binding protein [Chloroflexi bacterium]|nr:ABC transporter ATP-binding protein [Chloroflexota bacterium]MQC18692.1 ABC transporter ATP-binding protein [Chloroflexota bacterium]
MADGAGEPPADPVITARGLVKRYGAFTALDGPSFTVARGEIFGILGPNGAGKTTLVEILEGLTPATAGTASVLGIEVTERPQAVKARIGVQLQAASYHQYLTLREILELFGSFYPRRADPMELLRRVRLEDRADARMRTLSGGMKQRFSIVAALVNEPDLVFFDEPTAGLDPDARLDLWQIVREVRASGATVVLTTHYMEEAETLCDHVAFMNAGQMAAIDTPQGLIRRLNAPYRLTLTTAHPLPEADVRGIPGALEVAQEQTADGFVVRMRAQTAPSVTTALTTLASKAGTDIIDLAVQPATLEDVFLSVTGRRLSE